MGGRGLGFGPRLSVGQPGLAFGEYAPLASSANGGVEARIDLLQGIALVGVIIFIFMGLRNALIVAMVIPTSILIAIFMLDKSGFGLQQISIAGLVIALGLLVDNGVIYTGTGRETVALDARSCAVKWRFDYQPDSALCGGSNRGLALLNGLRPQNCWQCQSG